MANPRKSPYIWVTWLAKVMSGDATCHWQGWFQSHNQLTEKQSGDFDSAGWVISHTKMLTELKDSLFFFFIFSLFLIRLIICYRILPAHLLY